jgi:hypothetical protein
MTKPNPQADRAAAFNPQHRAYNPTSQQSTKSYAPNPQADRAAAFNPQHNAYNPTTQQKK